MTKSLLLDGFYLAQSFKKVLKKQQKLSKGPKFFEPSPLPSISSDYIDSLFSTKDVEIIPQIKHLEHYSSLPSSQIQRLSQYSQLGLHFGFQFLKSKITKQNHAIPFDHLKETLRQMRGAALKVGQMLSIQEHQIESIPEFGSFFQSLQNEAHAMPFDEIEEQFIKSFGPEWRHLFIHFDEKPFAAASIGQVHYGLIQDGNKKQPVAIKVQFPNIKKSIQSDLQSLKVFAKVLPKGLFLDNTIRVAQLELAQECDYIKEFENMNAFRKLLFDDFFMIPKPFKKQSSDCILTMEFIQGTSLGKLDPESLSQSVRNQIGSKLLEWSLSEIFVFGKMQTDPNFSNFLWRKGKVCLLDFGAVRSFDPEFVRLYFQLIQAAVERNEEKAIHYSIELGFLTGLEPKIMMDAHLISLFHLAEPFQTRGLYDFKSQTVSDEVRKQIPIMLRYRHKPPPDPSYSLHRKLSGAFLLCSKFGSQVDARNIFENIQKKSFILNSENDRNKV